MNARIFCFDIENNDQEIHGLVDNGRYSYIYSYSEKKSFWMSKFGFWILHFEFWILNFGLQLYYSLNTLLKI